MSALASLLAIDLFGVVILVWALNLVRRDRLYVGYGVIFLVAFLGLLMAEKFLTRKTLMPLAFGFVIVMLLYVLTQVTLLANRLATVVQEIAIDQAHKPPAL